MKNFFGKICGVCSWVLALILLWDSLGKKGFITTVSIVGFVCLIIYFCIGVGEETKQRNEELKDDDKKDKKKEDKIVV